VLRHRILALALGLLLIIPAAARAEDQARRGRLVVSVADQTSAMIPNAKVTVTSQEAGAAATAIPPVHSDEAGVAIVPNLADGRYTIQVEFPGFATSILQDVRVRGGDVRRRVTLQISKFDQQVTVARDAQSASLDPGGAAFSTVLTREQIEALPDDPDEMEAVLKAMSPPGATIRVDGFTGGKLPPKSQIRSIRLPKMDMFAAQNHGGMSGAIHIDIMTMPGNGPLRANVDMNYMDDALNARNAFSPEKGAEQVQQYGYSLSGTIKPNKASFWINGGVGTQYTAPIILAALPTGDTANRNTKQPRDSYNISGRVDYAFTKDHAMRASFDRSWSESRNLGVGAYDLVGRSYDSNASTNMLRLSENGPLGKRRFTETRLQLRWSDSASHSAVELPTIRVNEAFTSGGAQRKGGQHNFDVEFATDLDYVRGAHSWRTGVMLEGGRYRSDDISNYLGTYTFASLEAYEAGVPSNYSRRVGDPNITYSNYQFGAYLQDDWRVSRNLLVTPGVRFGVQSHAGGALNVSPRFTVAWSPMRNGTLTIRGSYGDFYDWIAGDLYKQTLLVDGVRLQDINILTPSYPDPGAGGAAAPSNQYLWSDSLVLPRAQRMNAGVDKALTKNGRVSATYSYGWGRDLLRGRNLNTPVGRVRPNPALANVVELQTDAESASHAFNVSYSYIRLDWKRTFMMANYNLASARTNTTGAFSLPANGDNLETEWGPSGGDIRHRISGSVSMAPWRDVSLSVNAGVRSGTPYNVTTGADNNGDGMFSDRPAGTTRNSARGAWQVDLGGRLSYAIGFGTARSAGGGAGGTQVVIAMGGGGGGAMAPGFGGGAESKRYRVEFYVSGQNLLNRVNYTAYSFVLTSPFYGDPVAASQPRRIQVGTRFGF
jgi:hypothetical protein